MTKHCPPAHAAAPLKMLFVIPLCKLRLQLPAAGGGVVPLHESYECCCLTFDVTFVTSYISSKLFPSPHV